MRSAAWATYALALSICVPALADRSRGKSISDCTSFAQDDKGDVDVEFTLHNTCTVPVDCTVSWRVVCAPDSKKRRSVHPGEAKISLDTGVAKSAQASASVCGDDGWAIDAVQWACEPNKE